VTLGSNVFTLPALLGISALIAGRIKFHRRRDCARRHSRTLDGDVSAWSSSRGLSRPAVWSAPRLIVFGPTLPSAPTPRRQSPDTAAGALVGMAARALAEERPSWRWPFDRSEGTVGHRVALAALIVVISGERGHGGGQATTLGERLGMVADIVGGLILAAVTSLPNLVAAVYLASRGRGGGYVE